MKKFKSIVLAVIGLLCSMRVSAEDFKVDGIYYDIISDTDKTVGVTYRGRNVDSYSNEYSGAVTIPESVTYNGNTYSVTSIGNGAFGACGNLKSVEIPNSVTSIGSSAFYRCSRLTFVVIPNSVTSIGSSAFYGCSCLTSVEIPNSVTSIGSSAFYGCSRLTSVEIPNSVTSIGSFAFYDCDGLTSVVIGNSVTSIGVSAFEGCSGLTSVVIPNSLTSIGKSVFYGCSGLTSVEIPNSVTSIGESAFSYCSRLTSVEIGNGVTSIGFGAFRNCSGLTSVEIPNCVTSIGGYAFYDCSGLTSVVIGNGVTSIGYEAFRDCSGLTSVVIGNGVTSIGDYAFAGCSGLTSVVIPNSVTSIEGYAFRSCSGLTSVVIPSSVTSIGEAAFSGTKNISSIIVDENNAYYDSRGNCNAIIETATNTLISGCKNTIIPPSVISIGDGAFSYCSGLTSVEIPNSVTSIGYRAFEYCSGLTSVLIGNSVTSIGMSAFHGTAWYNNQPDGVVYLENYLLGYKGTMPSNRSIEIKDGTLLIADYAFQLRPLTSVMIPNSVTSIGQGAFLYCSGLTSVVIPNSVTSIGYRAFEDCSSLTSVEIPNSVTSIENKAFSGCSGLTSVVIPNSVVSIGDYAFQYCSGLTSVVIPNSVTSIGMSAFADCSGLTSIEIPNSVSCIGDYAFVDCSGLTSVEVGNSVTSIGDYAFYNCSSLKSITSLNPTPPAILKHTTFSNYNATLYVPSGAKAAYSEAVYWKKFVNIEELVPLHYELTDGVAYERTSDCFVDSVTYTRTLPNLHWNALYVPFELPYDVIAEHYDVAYINDVNGYDTDDNGTIDDLAMEIVKIKGGTLKANYPYLIKAKTEADKEMSITLENAVLYAAAENSVRCFSVYQNYIVTGTYTGKTAEDLASKLVISDSGIWEPLAAGSDLSPLRLYLSIENRDNSPIEVESSAMSRMRIVLDYTPGDVDGDGRFSVVDISGIVGFVLGVDNPSLDARAADVNEDGRYSVVDVSTVVQYVLNGNASQRSVHRARTMVQASEEACSIYAKPFSMNPGEEKEIFVNLNNPSAEVTSLQFDLYLPEGISIVSTAEDDELLLEIYTGTRSSRTHMVESLLQPDGAVRCVVYSGKNASLKGNDGNVVSIKLKASDDLAAGNYQLRLSNQEVVLTEDVSTSMHPSETSCNVAVGEVTGINRIPHVEPSSVIYDLQGRPAKANQRGIYIVNGKLVIK